MPIYGPYTRRDGRQIVVVYDGKTRKTISYPKYLTQVRLGIVLAKDDVVHHKNEDITDDRDSNLQVLKRSAHTRLHSSEPELVRFHCPQCGQLTLKRAKDVRSNRRKGRAGPFCGRKCARANQLGGVSKQAKEADLKSADSNILRVRVPPPLQPDNE